MKKRILALFFLFLLIPISIYAARIVKSSFNAGEFSPNLYARIDLAKYANAVKTMDNFLPIPQGGATRRPGFEYIADVKDSDDEVRLIPFEYSNQQTYMLEFGDQYVRFYKNGGQIWTVDSYTKLLLHMNGEHNSTTFTDDGNTGHTVTANNGAKLKQGIGKWGTEAGKFDGSNDYLTIPDHADWAFGTGGWEIDTWIFFNQSFTYSSDHGIWHQGSSSTYYHCLFYNGTNHTIDFARDFNAVVTTYLSADLDDLLGYPFHSQFIHVAVTDDNSTLRLFINGELADTWTGSYNGLDESGSFTIGRARGDTESWTYFHGYIDEFRVSKGAYRWTAAFNAPDQEYPFGGAGGGGAAYEIVSPYSDADLDCIDYVQSADVLYLVHPDYTPRTLERTSDTSWAFSDFYDDFIAGKWPPFLDINITSTTITPSSTTGSITMSASASLWDSLHVDSFWALNDGYVQIDVVNSATSVDATVINTLSASDATADWWEGAWSDYQGYPRTVAFFEDRLAFGGTRKNVDRIHMSEPSDYQDFREAAITGGTAAASDSINLVLNSRQINGISWFATTRKFLVGTTGGEWWIGGASTNEILDATDIPMAHQDTGIGCEQCVKPVIIGNTVIFAERLGKKLREFYYKWDVDQYVGNDLSILASHFTSRFPIKQLAYQQTPYQIIWAITDDGRLLSLTYMKEHDVIGWAQHTVGGTDVRVESIAVIQGEYEDELWAAISRTINSSTEKYIERLSPIVEVETNSGEDTDWALEDAFFVDSGLTYRGPAATTISGLDHLEGESVVALADGVAISSLTVSSGSITLSTAASLVHVGLNYTSDIKTLWPVNTDNEGPMLGVAQRITNLYLLLDKTSGGQYGDSSGDLIDINYEWGDWDESTDYYSGATSDLAVSSSYEGTPTIFIRQNEPLPMTILGIVMEVQ